MVHRKDDDTTEHVRVLPLVRRRIVAVDVPRTPTRHHGVLAVLLPQRRRHDVLVPVEGEPLHRRLDLVRQRRGQPGGPRRGITNAREPQVDDLSDRLLSDVALEAPLRARQIRRLEADPPRSVLRDDRATGVDAAGNLTGETFARHQAEDGRVGHGPRVVRRRCCSHLRGVGLRRLCCALLAVWSLQLRAAVHVDVAVVVYVCEYRWYKTIPHNTPTAIWCHALGGYPRTVEVFFVLPCPHVPYLKGGVGQRLSLREWSRSVAVVGRKNGRVNIERRHSKQGDCHRISDGQLDT